MEERTVQNAKEVAESYTESSLNAFKTIVRIKNDWETLKDKMVKTSEFGKQRLISIKLLQNLTILKYCIK